jgi:hypothetical protein
MASKPPFPPARCAELEADQPPDYFRRTCAQLREEHEKQRIDHKDLRLKVELVASLGISYARDKVKFQTWQQIRAALVDRREHMFISNYTAEPERKSFLELPPEIRNMIYRYTFTPIPSGPTVWGITYSREVDSLCTSILSPGSHKLPILSALGVLSAMNKQIRSEARGVFWAVFPFTIDGPKDIDYHQTIRLVLNKLGPEGRASIPQLSVRLINMHIHQGYLSYVAFNEIMLSLKACVNLRELRLSLGVSQIFWSDRDMLEGHLLHGQAFRSTGIANFITMLQSLPNLRKVDLELVGSWLREYGLFRHEPDKFLQYAFSGAREQFLWTKLANALQSDQLHTHREAQKLGNIEVLVAFPSAQSQKKAIDFEGDVQGYSAWLNWRDAKVMAWKKYGVPYWSRRSLGQALRRR